MRITRFHGENFKRLKAVDITPQGNAVVIGGRNAQGKSSVLDGIMAALSGKKGSKELVRPIRDGESKARVVVELDDLVVERKWTASGSTVTVSPKDGNARLNSPQAVLDKLIGALSFDPLAFAEAEPKKQVETLIDLIGREDFDRIAGQRRAAYDERTEVNRQAKSIRARREALGLVSTEPTEPVDVVEVLGRLEVERERAALREEWSSVNEKIIQLSRERDAIFEKAAKLPDAQDGVTVEVLTERLRTAEATNVIARRYDDAKALDEELADVEAEAERLTRLVTAADHERTALISGAALPVDGLSFDEEGVSYNGVPFVQSSAAERLKVSVAMAMAMNPDLRVICIRDASLLDNDSKAALVAMAERHDYQLWLEVVGDPGEIGVIIEDGTVQA